MTMIAHVCGLHALNGRYDAMAADVHGVQSIGGETSTGLLSLNGVPRPLNRTHCLVSMLRGEVVAYPPSLETADG